MNIVLNGDAPTARAASTYSISRTESDTALITLVVPAIPVIAIAVMTVYSPEPIPTSSSIAKMIPGKAIRISRKRWLMRSNFPPVYPVTIPHEKPMSLLRITETKATNSDVRVPMMIRLRTSRPRLSLPRGRSRDGGLLKKAGNVSNGSFGASTLANIATRPRNTRKPAATAPIGEVLANLDTMPNAASMPLT